MLKFSDVPTQQIEINIFFHKLGEYEYEFSSSNAAVCMYYVHGKQRTFIIKFFHIEIKIYIYSYHTFDSQCSLAAITAL
jgi:hypothetical protein